jgi:hypothetical protein
MTCIHSGDDYGRTTQRYIIQYQELTFTWYDNSKLVTKQFAFKNKSSWTYYHAHKVAKMLKDLGYLLVEVVPCNS